MRSPQLAEFRAHWRVLLAAFVGLGFGVSLGPLTASLFGPHLLEEFGWSRSQYALVSTVSLVMLLILPLAGRLTDLFGVRRVAIAGVVGIPACEVGLSQMSGSFFEFLAFSTLMSAFSALVSPAIYSSLVADRFAAARGIAFAIIMSGPALVSVIANPLLAGVMLEHGWRFGYLALAAMTLIGGLFALCIVPAYAARKDRHSANTFWQDFCIVARQRMFWLIVGGMFLCNLPQTFGSVQMTLIGQDAGASAEVAVTMLSAYAVGIVIGRIVSGFALDKYQARLVAAVLLCLPALGFLGLWSSFDLAWFLVSSTVLVGMAQGAEGDVAAYLVSRHFDIKTYGFVMGMVTSALPASSAAGGLVLSVMLQSHDDYMPFLLFSAVVTLIGASLFLGLRKLPPVAIALVEPASEKQDRNTLLKGQN